MITFYPECEVTLSVGHFVISRLILLETFHVLDVLLDVAATANRDKVDQIGWNQENEHDFHRE